MRTLTAFILALLLPSLTLSQDTNTTVRLADRTDWWSVLNENFEWPNNKPKGDELAAANFEIAGLNLEGDTPFRNLREKLGWTISALRSKGNNGREQFCYVFGQNPSVRLVFEHGESNESFYLFTEGQPWNGQALCAGSTQLKPSLRTKSGLGLGISPTEVEQVLGKPDFSFPNRFIYYRDIEKHTPDDKLAQLRSEHSDLTDKEFHDSYDSYDLELYIEVRFTDGKLTYLAVSKGESY
ncbi:MAG TPA: hypothetical protein VN682_14985 [Terriglobales bacterium]|jgi:hypothetical protein|nr:hypothetical protein [Terriglobales bacterium]